MTIRKILSGRDSRTHHTSGIIIHSRWKYPANSTVSAGATNDFLTISVFCWVALGTTDATPSSSAFRIRLLTALALDDMARGSLWGGTGKNDIAVTLHLKYPVCTAEVHSQGWRSIIDKCFITEWPNRYHIDLAFGNKYILLVRGNVTIFTFMYSFLG